MGFWGFGVLGFWGVPILFINLKFVWGVSQLSFFSILFFRVHIILGGQFNFCGVRGVVPSSFQRVHIEHCSAVQCSAVQCSAVQCSAVQCSVV